MKNSSEAQSGIIDTVQGNMNMSNIMGNLHNSKDLIFESAIYGGIGFLSGFLFKKYNTYVVVVVLMIAGLALLSHMGLVHVVVEWNKVSEMTGMAIAAPVSGDTALSLVVEFVKANKAISISGLIGFVLGLKMG